MRPPRRSPLPDARALTLGVALALALAFAACARRPARTASAAPPDAPATFIALHRDFVGYERWARVAAGDGRVPGHPAGPWVIYRNRALPPGATAYPVGTILVKEVRAGPARDDWELFAMVKRGGDYNERGARGWEYFVMRLSPAGVPVITARGTSPSGADEYEGADSEEGCNGCHADADAARSDHVLSPALAPPRDR